MPTADSFTALGRGNGFPFCHTNIHQIDISSSYYSNSKWTTLSGVNSDNYNSFDGATLSQKVDSSRDMAMHIYWNKIMSNGLSASSSGSYSYFSSTKDIDLNWNDSVTLSSGDDSVPEPINRICPASYSNINRYYGTETIQPHRFFYYFSDFISRLYAFYDSDKFLGYGADLTSVGSDLTTDSVGWGLGRIEYEAIIRNPSSNVNESFYKRSTDFSTINDMHFVRYRLGWARELSQPSSSNYYNWSISPSITLNTNGVQLSYSHSWDYYNPSTEESRSRDVDFQLSVSGPTSIDFYTYT
jgi:hypothetical protein